MVGAVVAGRWGEAPLADCSSVVQRVPLRPPYPPGRPSEWGAVCHSFLSEQVEGCLRQAQKRKVAMDFSLSCNRCHAIRLFFLTLAASRVFEQSRHRILFFVVVHTYFG